MNAPDLLSPQSLEDLLLYRMSQILGQAGAQVTRVCEAEFGITRRQWRIIALLACSEGVLSSQLAERAHLDRARTSRALTSLADKGLVQRTPKPSNRREIILHLTPAGHALHTALLPRAAAINQQLLSALKPEEAQHLAQLLHRLQAQALHMTATTPDASSAAEHAKSTN